MHQSVPSANIPRQRLRFCKLRIPTQPAGICTNLNPPGSWAFAQKILSTYMVIGLKILLAILSRFVLVVDSMYRNHVRKIVVSMQTVKDFCCLIKKDRHMNLSKLSKIFAVYLIYKKQHGANL